MEKVLMSREKFDELSAELKYLKTVKMAEIEADIQEARGHGDLSENAEYDAAKDAQAQTHARIVELEQILDNAEIIDETSIDTSAVNIGVLVTVTNVGTKQTMELKIVGEQDADIYAVPMRISNKSPIGAALMGHKKGETVEVRTPAGLVKYKITKIAK